MSVKEKLQNMLVHNGMSEDQATDVMKYAIPRFQEEIRELCSGYTITLDRPASEYPDMLYPLFFERLKPFALQWIDKNKPQAWFRGIFAS